MSKYRLVWIGTGNAFNFERGHTSFFMEGRAGRALLVDCGATVPLALIERGDVNCITDIAITHLHADHVGGLEGLIFYAYFVLGMRGSQRLRIHVATDEFAHALWEKSLRGGMEFNVTENMDAIGMTLEDYAEIHVNKTVQVEGLPAVEFFPTEHVKRMENYGLNIGDNVRYSGDTIEPPNVDVDLIFQDCDFREPSVPGIHLTYSQLCRAVPEEEDRQKIHLVHVGVHAEIGRPLRDGFAGIIENGQEFDLRF